MDVLLGHFCCDQAYQITNYSDIRFGGNGYLKWVQAAACSWFIADSMSGL